MLSPLCTTCPTDTWACTPCPQQCQGSQPVNTWGCLPPSYHSLRQVEFPDSVAGPASHNCRPEWKDLHATWALAARCPVLVPGQVPTPGRLSLSLPVPAAHVSRGRSRVKNKCSHHACCFSPPHGFSPCLVLLFPFGAYVVLTQGIDMHQTKIGFEELSITVLTDISAFPRARAPPETRVRGAAVRRHPASLCKP